VRGSGEAGRLAEGKRQPGHLETADGQADEQGRRLVGATRLRNARLKVERYAWPDASPFYVNIAVQTGYSRASLCATAPAAAQRRSDTAACAAGAKPNRAGASRRASTEQRRRPRLDRARTASIWRPDAAGDRLRARPARNPREPLRRRRP
jgi:hypothetical protein